MSRSFTISAECLGTKLEWDIGVSLAESVVGYIVEDLAETCSASQTAGDGYSGTVTHRKVGLVAYYHISRLATEMFERKSTAHSIMLRKMCEQYEEVMHSAQELTFLLGEESLLTNAETARHAVDEVLKQVERLNVAIGVPIAFVKMKQEGLLVEDLTLNEFQTVFNTQDWALSLTVTATY